MNGNWSGLCDESTIGAWIMGSKRPAETQSELDAVNFLINGPETPA